MAEKLYTAIIFFTNKKVTKFRNISHSGLTRLNRWAHNNNVAYYNVYEKKTRQFAFKVYVTDVYCVTFLFQNIEPLKFENVYNINDVIHSLVHKPTAYNAYNLRTHEILKIIIK